MCYLTFKMDNVKCRTLYFLIFLPTILHTLFYPGPSILNPLPTHIYPSHYTPLSPLPYTALHYTSLHFPSFHFITFFTILHDFHFTSLVLGHISITFNTLYISLTHLNNRFPYPLFQRLNTSAGTWFQSWIGLSKKEYFIISVLGLLLLIFHSWSTLLR